MGLSQDRARAIEGSIAEHHRQRNAYAQQSSSLLSNMRGVRFNGLLDRSFSQAVLGGAYTPEELANMPATAMAPALLRQQRPFAL